MGVGIYQLLEGSKINEQISSYHEQSFMTVYIFTVFASLGIINIT